MIVAKKHLFYIDIHSLFEEASRRCACIGKDATFVCCCFLFCFRRIRRYIGVKHRECVWFAFLLPQHQLQCHTIRMDLRTADKINSSKIYIYNDSRAKIWDFWLRGRCSSICLSNVCCFRCCCCCCFCLLFVLFIYLKQCRLDMLCTQRNASHTP